MKLFDSHLHLTASDFSDQEIEAAVGRAVQGGVTALMNVATDRKSFKRAQMLSSLLSEYGIDWYQAAATSPQDVYSEDRELFFSEIEACALETDLLQAIGETGLDYYYTEDSKREQQELFNRYIELAKKTDLPLIIHCRSAFQDFFSIIESHGTTEGVVHCFTGTKEDAKRIVDLGWYISFSGIVTYKKSTEELREIASFIPDESFLLETDAPYLSPVPKRGSKNEPLFLTHTLECIAKLRGSTLEAVAETSFRNSERLFGKKKRGGNS